MPDVILATIELPEDLPVVGIGCLLQASVCRPKRDLRSESNAKEISDGLPFLGELREFFRAKSFNFLLNSNRIRTSSPAHQQAEGERHECDFPSLCASDSRG